MSYKILQSNTIKGLEKQVNDYIKDGYEPIGGMSTLVSDKEGEVFKFRSSSLWISTHFIQSMYKREEFLTDKKDYIGPKRVNEKDLDLQLRNKKTKYGGIRTYE